jgi:hypothetical protein
MINEPDNSHDLDTICGDGVTIRQRRQIQKLYDCTAINFGDNSNKVLKHELLETARFFIDREIDTETKLTPGEKKQLKRIFSVVELLGDHLRVYEDECLLMLRGKKLKALKSMWYRTGLSLGTCKKILDPVYEKLRTKTAIRFVEALYQ